MRDFRFDLQLFGTVAIAADPFVISGLAADGETTYWTAATGKKVESTTSATAVVSVTVATNGTYTLAYGSLNGTTFTANASDWGTVADIKIIAGSSAASYTLDTSGAAGDVVGTNLTMTSATGGTISDGTLTYQAASGKTATIKFGATAAASELTDGSITMTTSSVKANGEVLTVSGTGASLVVDSAGKISSIAANTTFKVGNDATPTNGYTYVVSADGLYVTLTSANGTTTNGTYYLTNALKNTTVTINGVNATFNEISNGSLAADALINVGTVGVYGFSDGKTKMYVYQKNGVVFNAGYVDSTLGDQVGVLTPDGSGNFSYDASVAKSGQTITDDATTKVTKVTGSGYNDTITFDDEAGPVTIDGGAGKDIISVEAMTNSSIVGGAGNDTITLAAVSAAQTGVFVGGGEGADSIKAGALLANSNAYTIASGAGDDIIDLDGATNAVNEWLIDAGDGNNTVNVGAGIQYSTITAGSGNDTIHSTSDTNTITGGSGADVFDISGTYNANISDYAFGTDRIKVANATGTEVSFLGNVNTVAQTATNMTADGVLKYGTGVAGNGAATITSSNAFYAVGLVDNTTAKNKVSLAWTKEDAATINGGSMTEKTVLVGTTNSEGDLLIGGSKADTIYAGASDSVYGGAGADAISIGASAYGVYVGVATDSGADTVADFNEGFDIDSADAVYMVNGSIEDATISNDGTDITIKNGKGGLELTGKGSNSTSGVKLLVGDKKVYSIAEGTQLTISDSEELADYFYGTKSAANGSGIDLSNYADDVSVNLSSSMFKNIASVTGGKGNTTLMGSKAAETLFGGTGATSLYGGAGKDSLVSGAGVTTFFLTTGAGKDTVYGFVTGTNEDSSDVLNIFNAGLTGISRSSDSTFTLKVSDTDSLLVNQATSGVDQKIQYASGSAKGVAKIGYTSTANSFSYDEEVTNYLGGSKNDTLAFGSGSDDVNVWLDQTSVYSSIETFDASSRSGSVLLAGTAASETLRGGTGESSLWGGAGNAKDVLVGNSSGTTSFFYGMGQGSDSISGSSNDTMNLYDIQLSDLASATLDTANRRVIFTTTAGDTVSVSGGVQDFVVGGVTYTTTYASDTDWSVKE